VSVGLLLITDAGIGSELLAAATRMLGVCPLPARALSVRNGDDPALMGQRARAFAAELDAGEGVLVLTDLFGSTPANIATSLGEAGYIRVLSGVNLPMLVRVLNYPKLSLDALVDKALSGARDGVLVCTATPGTARPPAARPGGLTRSGATDDDAQ
jgi:PTS system ascorbate-specific IIA component